MTDTTPDTTPTRDEAVRMFPIMGGPKVPWSLIEPYEAQAQTNHSQTLKQLAGRGGLSMCEAMAIMSSVPYRQRPIANPTVEDWLDFIAERKAKAEKRAMLASAPAPASGGVDAVTVKPLEWLDTGISWQAASSAGTYVIPKRERAYKVFLNSEIVSVVPEHGYRTADEAKAAAQADYEQRIRSALSPAATPLPTIGRDDDQAHLDAARAAYFAAGGRVNDPRRAQKVSRIQIAIRNGNDGILGDQL